LVWKSSRVGHDTDYHAYTGTMQVMVVCFALVTPVTVEIHEDVDMSVMDVCARAAFRGEPLFLCHIVYIFIGFAKVT